jgi:hypothetical protein
MANCTICDCEIENSKPMVLVGNKLFIKGAGNGRAWSGPAPAIRLWKTFALLSIGVCQKCVEQHQKEQKRRIINNLILTGVFIILTILSAFLAPPRDSALPMIPGVAGIVFLVKFIHSLMVAIDEGGASDSVISHYLKTKKIPRKDIIAIVHKATEGEINDINIKETMSTPDYFLGTGSYIYNLQLFTREDLLGIGKIIEGSGHTAFQDGLEKARLDARALFENVGVPFEI